MATIITKNSSTAAAVPVTADLVAGELAVNTTDGTLYVGTGTGVLQVGDSDVGSLGAANTWTALNTFTGGLATSGGTVATLTDIASDAAVVANTAKVGITTAQANAIESNSSKAGISTAQANAIVANTAKVGISTAQANAINVNSGKVTYKNLLPLTNTWTANNYFKYVTVTSMVSSGDVTANSDSRLKKEVKPIENALDKVDAINGVTFSVIGGDDTRRTGVIAQDVQAVLPEAVHQDEDGLLSVAYGNMVGLLVEAVKELRAEVAELKGEK